MGVWRRGKGLAVGAHWLGVVATRSEREEGVAYEDRVDDVADRGVDTRVRVAAGGARGHQVHAQVRSPRLVGILQERDRHRHDHLRQRAVGHGDAPQQRAVG